MSAGATAMTPVTGTGRRRSAQSIAIRPPAENPATYSGRRGLDPVRGQGVGEVGGRGGVRAPGAVARGGTPGRPDGEDRQADVARSAPREYGVRGVLLGAVERDEHAPGRARRLEQDVAGPVEDLAGLPPRRAGRDQRLEVGATAKGHEVVLVPQHLGIPPAACGRGGLQCGERRIGLAGRTQQAGPVVGELGLPRVQPVGHRVEPGQAVGEPALAVRREHVVDDGEVLLARGSTAFARWDRGLLDRRPHPRRGRRRAAALVRVCPDLHQVDRPDLLGRRRQLLPGPPAVRRHGEPLLLGVAGVGDLEGGHPAGEEHVLLVDHDVAVAVDDRTDQDRADQRRRGDPDPGLLLELPDRGV